jgi:hypothetical protein
VWEAVGAVEFHAAGRKKPAGQPALGAKEALGKKDALKTVGVPEGEGAGPLLGLGAYEGVEKDTSAMYPNPTTLPSEVNWTVR